MNGEERIENPGVAEESAYAEKPLRDAARDESLKITSKEKGVLDHVAEKVGKKTQKEFESRGAHETKPVVEKYEVLAEEEIAKVAVGSQVKVIEGVYAGMKGEFYKVGAPDVFYKGQPVIRVTFGPKDMIGTDIIPKSTDDLVPLERIARVPDLRAGARILTGRGEKGTVTNQGPSAEYKKMYGENSSVVGVLLDGGEYWDASPTAEVVVLSNLELSLKK